ncbi:MAG: energy-coupling factor transporter transmembrane protein EcfT [Nitrospirota bacterium]|nr:energy-coupling factor transporter transmembrane protein EcfT [Nitrospirota bacterium]
MNRLSLPSITLGRYVAGDTAVHRLDPRTKLLAYALLCGALFTVNSPASLGVATLFLLISALASQIKPGRLIKGLIPFAWLFAITGLTHVFSTGGTSLPFFPLGPVDVTWEGINAGFLITSKLALMVMGSMVLAATTSPAELTFGMERLLSPLRLFRIDVTRWAAMLSLSIAFIPMLQEEAARLMAAQKSRGMAAGQKGIINKGREMSPLIPLLFTRLFEKAALIGDAFSGRGYTDGTLSAAVREHRFHRRDFVAGGITITVAFIAISL